MTAARDEARKLAERIRRKREDAKQIEKVGRSHRYKPVTITLADVDDLLTALDALVALVERAERERDEALEALRDANAILDDYSGTWPARVRAAEARVEKLEATLRAVAKLTPGPAYPNEVDTAIKHARAALSGLGDAGDTR